MVEIVAIAIMLAKIGDEQGLDASAKNVPIKNGKMNRLPDFFCGIFFIIVGNCISIKPTRFNPRIIIIDEKTNKTIGVAKLVKALPVNAQITPIMLSTSDNPKEKDNICINNFLFPSLEYPPTYPIIRGNMPKLQGVSEDKTPAKNDTANNIGRIKELPEEYAENT